MNIVFYNEVPNVPNYDAELLKKWIYIVANEYGLRVGNISYLFCDDAKILEINNTYLKHDYYTDIITFDYSSSTTISGDLFISVDTVQTNADMLKESVENEFHRIVIHGILHLCGINDKTVDERRDMTEREDNALQILRSL